MSLLNKADIGEVHITQDAIEKAAGISALDCYGIVGMASQNRLKDGVFELLGRENASKGIAVSEVDGNLVVDINIIVKYGVKISEVARSIQEKVGFDLKQMLGLNISEVNVTIQGVQVVKEDK